MGILYWKVENVKLKYSYLLLFHWKTKIWFEGDSGWIDSFLGVQVNMAKFKKNIFTINAYRIFVPHCAVKFSDVWVLKYLLLHIYFNKYSKKKCIYIKYILIFFLICCIGIFRYLAACWFPFQWMTGQIFLMRCFIFFFFLFKCSHAYFIIF